MKDEAEAFRFPQLTSNGKELLCVLGQWVYDREAPQMSADERKRITQATRATILMVMGFQPRSL
jgi:hypothetical protein